MIADEQSISFASEQADWAFQGLVTRHGTRALWFFKRTLSLHMDDPRAAA